MIRCDVCALKDVPQCAFVVTFARCGQSWVFSRHRDRATWETQGGHVEPGETPLAAARRELYEEAGAVARSLRPICGYWAERDGDRRYGIVYFAEVERLDPLPPSEMAQARRFDALPDALTYPEITPVLFAHLQTVLAQEEEDA